MVKVKKLIQIFEFRAQSVPFSSDFHVCLTITCQIALFMLKFSATLNTQDYVFLK